MVKLIKLDLTMVNLTKFSLVIISLPKVTLTMVNIINCIIIFNYASIPMASRFLYLT